MSEKKVRYFLHNGKKDRYTFRYCVSVGATKRPVLEKLKSKYPDGFVALFDDNVYYDTFRPKDISPYRNRSKQWRKRSIDMPEPFAFVFNELRKLNNLEVHVI